ncbi:MMPL family transporter [Nocardia sp. CDC153]|uniref:MMPL family transporter n=1 Tax=Nocardia sp. CDC153 TaxID=3112167 RepID=UPI002DBAC8BF|nr:MMPL family transporter [Nocardia sp. CDC153]MEC3952015.1 MMPL family transporter [Nocardia sp. CDC153]
MFAQLGRVLVRHPWKVIVVWLFAAIAIASTAPKLEGTADQSAFLPSHYESVQAMNLQEKAFPNVQAPDAVVVFERADGAPLTDEDAALVTSVAAKLADAHVKDVTAIATPVISPRKLVGTATVQMTKVTDPNDKTQSNAVKNLRDALRDALKDTDLRGGITGHAAQVSDRQASNHKALQIIGSATILLVLVLVAIIFRSPVIALLPILVIAGVSSVVNGLIAWVSKAFDLKSDPSVSSLLIVVLFGVGTDYILFLMFRYRERLRAGEGPNTAMVNALARVGESIVSAGGAVIVAFLALTLSTLGMFKSLGPSLAIAVSVTLLAGLTLVPAIVSLLGTRAFWPSKAWRHEPKGAVAARIGVALGRRPTAFAVAAGVILVGLAVPALGFHPSFDLSSGGSSNSVESATFSTEMHKDMPAGATSPTDVLLRSDTGAPLGNDQLEQYRTMLSAVSGVSQVAPKAFLSDDRTVADFRVTLSDSPESDRAIDTVKGPLRDAAHAAPAATSGLVGGMTAVLVDSKIAMNHDYAVVFPVAALAILVVLTLLLRSAVAPLYLVATVGLGFIATLGATVLVFQHLRGEAGVTFMMPVVMYLFVVALGTDYNILIVARLREEIREGRSAREAAAQAVRHAGPTIAATGLILAGTFASMMLAGNVMMEQMGFAISLGIAITAFVMAMFLTPAVTVMLGRAVWWPGGRQAVNRMAEVDRRPQYARR